MSATPSESTLTQRPAPAPESHISSASTIAILLATLATLFVVAVAGANVPSPPNCSLPASVTLSGTGNCCFTVTVRDFNNVVIPGSVVRVDFGSCTVGFCATQPPGLTVGSNYAETVTLASGLANFCICGTLTGSCTATIYADGVAIGSVPVTNCSACATTLPLTMSYQGVLTDNSGNAAPDGSYNFKLSIYDDPTLSGTHLLWTENQSGIAVSRGGFSMILGMGTPAVPLALPFDRQYYLGIAAALAPGTPGAEFAPRTTLAASPYSLTARSVANCGVTSAAIADGQVVKSLNGLHDDVTIAGSGGVSVSQSGQTMPVSVTGGLSFAGGPGSMGGSGTPNNLAKFTAATTLGNSILYETGGRVGVNTTSPQSTLDVSGSMRIDGNVDFTAGHNFVFTAPFVYGMGMIAEGSNPNHTLTVFDNTTGTRVNLLTVTGNNVNALGNVGIGTTTPGTRLDVNGGTKLGAGAPAIKMLKVTGTTGSTDGSYAILTTGVTSSKILSVSLLVNFSGDRWEAPNDIASASTQYTWYLEENGQLYVYMVPTHSSQVHSKPVKALVTYEE